MTQIIEDNEQPSTSLLADCRNENEVSHGENHLITKPNDANCPQTIQLIEEPLPINNIIFSEF